MAQADYFLKLDGIDGESTDKGHEKWIEVESFSWGLQNAVAAGGTGGAGTGKPVPGDVQVVVPYSLASEQLFLSCCTGEHIKTAVLSCRQSASNADDFLKYELTDVIISSYNTQGAVERPVDEVALNFGKLEIDYSVQNADGTLGTPIHVGFDFRTFQKV